MKDIFYDFVSHELEQTLPVNWQHIAEDQLPGAQPCEISHAFHAHIAGESKMVNILVLPLSIKLNADNEKQLLMLRDLLLSERVLLIVINEEPQADYLADTGTFISERLLVHSPDFIWISCYLDKNNKMTFDGIHYEYLHRGLAKVWEGRLIYAGPRKGLQQVNLEIMKGNCWKCGKEIKTITGLVFPDKQLTSWKNTTWKYYNGLLNLSQIMMDDTILIADFIEMLRIKDPVITPVSFRFNDADQESYFAASCPYCGETCDEFYVNDERTGLLHSLQSRIDGSLKYYSLKLNIDQYLIDRLYNCCEACVHTTDGGWITHTKVSFYQLDKKL
ncbi:hypothetical protein ABIB62_004117 [Mucilaginibacter sp. UYP25]|uniref:hypothetical protein n=1 Tax=unclassified Mucilaginibacter TaxID=2617802 RepID=UPI00339223FD